MIAKNLNNIQQRINQAAHRAGRNLADINLVGVSKHNPVETMLQAYQAGLRHFGENRVEEMQNKLPDFLAATNPQDPPTIHFIGHLQSRKVANALQYAHLIHAIDSLKLAQRINRLAVREQHPPVSILLECNVSGEKSKAGFKMQNWQADNKTLTVFLETVTEISKLSHIKILGLMTMAPIVANAELTRPYFKSLRHLLTQCTTTFPHLSWSHLSMGMTADFEVAIEEGATMVRVGRAIFSK